MSDIRLDQSGDIALEAGQLSLNDGIESIRQHLQVRLRFFLGEWFLDQTVGVPYFQNVFVDRPRANVLTTVFKREILATPGVIELEDFALSIDRATRTLSVSFKAKTDFGLLDFSAAVP